MAKFSESTLEEIKAKISLVEVVSHYLTLKKRGERYWGLCPFHTEKTPSFSVLPDKGFYHCFGCGKSGSIFDFIMEMESLTFVESVRYLAEKSGVELTAETPQERQKRSEVALIRELYAKLAASFHYILLQSDHGQAAREYLAARHVAPEMFEKFTIGYAPADPNWLYRFLRSKQYSSEALALSGLFSKNNATYSLFCDRLMFPVRDWQGNFVAFGGRDLSGKSRAKYINTPETLSYRKREVLFGMYESMNSIKKEEQFILCEGNFDVLALHQAGMTTAVSPLGTAFTPEQGKLLRRYAKTGYILFDNDRAGQEAAQKALILSEQLGFDSNVIILQEAKDPAELLQQAGEEALKRACGVTKSAFLHLVHSALSMYDTKKPKGKLQVLNAVKPYLDAVDSHIVRQGYLKDLSELLGIDEETVSRDYQRATPRGAGPVGGEDLSTPFAQKNISWNRSLDLYALTALINNRSLFVTYRSKLPLSYLQDDLAIALYTVLEDSIRSGESESDDLVLEKIEDSELKQMVALSFQTREFSQQPKELLDEAVYRLKLRHLEEQRRRVEQLLKMAEREGSSTNDIDDLLLEKRSLDEEITKMRKPEHV